MKVAIVGGSGLVGRALTRSLTDDGHEVLVLSRDPSSRAKHVTPPARIAAWSKDDVDGLARAIDGFDSVVSVAGARVAPLRWTRGRKATITTSRRDAVGAIADAMAAGESVAVEPDDDVVCAREIQVLAGDTLVEVKVAGDGAVLEVEVSDENED